MGNSFVAGAKCYIPFKRELGGHGVPPAPANENLYWEKTTEDELGSGWIVREKVKSWEPDEKYETLRKQYSDAMIAAESAKDEIRILKQENTALHNNFSNVVKENDKLREKDKELVYENKCLREELDSLRRAIVVPEECAVNEQSPEAKAYEDMHTKRMAAEVRSIELDNKAKRNALTKEVVDDTAKKRLNAYAQQVRDQQLDFHSLKNRLAMAECVSAATEYQTMHSPISAKFHTDRLYKNLIWLWGTVVAFAVNEVIQWLTR